MENQTITQPRNVSDGNHALQPAAPADFGTTGLQPSHYALNDENVRVTGPPPIHFRQQKQNNLSPESTRTLLEPGPKPVTREPLPRQASGGLAPPVTKGAPQTGPPPSPFNSTSAVTPSPLLDHDYCRQPSATTDHDYFVRPPPGFTYPPQHSGRPTRTSNLPKRFQDFDMN